MTKHAALTVLSLIIGTLLLVTLPTSSHALGNFSLVAMPAGLMLLLGGIFLLMRQLDQR